MSEHDPIDWDELDAETQHELVSLAEKLGGESGQSGGRTASRREFLGAITAAGLSGSLLSQGADRAFEDFVNPASAGTQSVAQFGKAGEPFDIVAEDVYGPGGKGSGDAVHFEAVSAPDINNAVVVTDSFDGGDIGARFNSARSENPDARQFVLPPGTYTVTTPFDLTSNQSTTNRIRVWMFGATLKGETAGSPVFDMTGGRFHSLYGGEIRGQGTNAPSTGVLMARDDSNKSAGSHDLLGAVVTGSYTEAAIYNYGAEEVSLKTIRARNDTNHVISFNANNPQNLTSDYVTIATGQRSTNGLYITDGSKIVCDAADASSVAVISEGSSGNVIRDSFVASNGLAHIMLDSSNRVVEVFHLSNTRTHGWPGSTVDDVIKQTGGNDCVSCRFENNAIGNSGAALRTDGAETWIDLQWIGNEYHNHDTAPKINGTVSGISQIEHTDTSALGDSVMLLDTVASGSAVKFTSAGQNLNVNTNNGHLYQLLPDQAKLRAVGIDNVSAKLTSGTNTPVSSGATETVNWDTVAIDDSGLYTVDLANNAITVDLDGKYEVYAVIRWDSDTNFSAGDRIQLGIKINGVQESRARKGAPHSGTEFIPMEIKDEFELNADDTVTITARQDSGSTIDVNAFGQDMRFVLSRSG